MLQSKQRRTAVMTKVIATMRKRVAIARMKKIKRRVILGNLVSFLSVQIF